MPPTPIIIYAVEKRPQHGFHGVVRVPMNKGKLPPAACMRTSAVVPDAMAFAIEGVILELKRELLQAAENGMRLPFDVVWIGNPQTWGAFDQHAYCNSTF